MMDRRTERKMPPKARVIDPEAERERHSKTFWRGFMWGWMICTTVVLSVILATIMLAQTVMT